MRFASTFQPLVIEVVIPPPGHTAAAELGAIVPSLVSVVFVAIGWFVVERYARARERRADMRELVKALSAAVDDVSSTAHEFYLLAGEHPRAQTLGAAIRAKMGALPRMLDAIKETGFAIEWQDQLRQFRQTVTSGNFDQRDRVASAEDAPIFPEITAAGRSLTAEVQVALIRAMSTPKKPRKRRTARSRWIGR